MAEHIVDAALSSADGTHETRFYLGDQYVVFSYDGDRVRDGVHPVTVLGLGSPFSPDGVGQSFDAALAGRKQFGGTGYHFRGQDLGSGPDDVGGSSIGEHSFVMNPDHPTSSPGTPHGREAHNNHLHMQIGVTGTA